MTASPPRASRRRLLGVGGFLFCLLLPGLLFVANGLAPGWRTPDSGHVEASGESAPSPNEVSVLAYNLAQARFHRGGFDFASEAEVCARLDGVAAELIAARADLVFLSEIIAEGGPCDVHQVSYLARAAHYPYWAFGANYSFGLPFFRIRAGNAILSRHPLQPLEVTQLPGGTPFWNPTNNRRILWAKVQLPGGEPLRIASVRNDSFDLDNNARQAAAILARHPDRPLLLAGDFNAEPHDEAIRLFRDSRRFAPTFDGPPTFPAVAPTRRIDYVLAPSTWEVLAQEVLPAGDSDHRAVLARFRRR